MLFDVVSFNFGFRRNIYRNNRDRLPDPPTSVFPTFLST